MPSPRIVLVDSGKGGRYLFEFLRTKLPEWQFFCETDEVNVPYGEKTPAELQRLGAALINRAVAHEPDLIIVACHTLSSWCFAELQAESTVPLWSINDILAGEIQNLPQGSSTTLWGTPKTIESQWFGEFVKHYRPDLRFQQVACPGLATAIENQDQDILAQLLEKYLANESAENLVLACTHYPVVLTRIQEKFSGRIIDSSKALLLKLHKDFSPQPKDFSSFTEEENAV